MAGIGRDFRNISADGMPTVPHRLVTKPIVGPGYHVEVREYHCQIPLDDVFETTDNHVEFTLSPYGWIGGYPRAFDDLRPIGQIMLVPEGERFRAGSQIESRRALVCGFTTKKIQEFDDIAWSKANLARTVDIRNLRLEALLFSMMEEVFSPGVASTALIDAEVLSLAVELRRHFGAELAAPKPGRLAPWQLRLIRERVDDGLGPPPSIGQLAVDCGVSVSSLMRIFKTTTGMTLGGYIRNARLFRAKRLLSRPGSMIKQTSFECGFETPAAFAAAFRKATGMTPNEYRKMVRFRG